jgi:hypothetical protein
MRHVLPLLLLLAPVAGCSRRVSFEDNVLSKPRVGVAYTVGEVPEDWRRVRLRNNDLAFFQDESGHAMAVNSTCKDHGDPPLDVLTRHLLMGFTEPQQVSQETTVVDEREALRSHYLAKLDGVPVELLLVVLKKDNCVYDLQYVAPLGRFGARVADFESLVRGFHAERAS